ncbi:MAG: hypothetical protein ACRENP_01340 [Longimicrobiales bacterium]
MSRAAARAVLVSMCAAVSTACYSYVPVQSPRPGMDVRARLTTEAAVRRSQGLDDPIVRLDGRIVESTASSLSLDVLVARSSSAFQDIVIRDTVRLEIAEIQSIMASKVSPWRTALFTLGAAAAAFGVVKGIDQIVGGTGEEDGGGDPAFTVPIVRWIGFRQLRAGMAR